MSLTGSCHSPVFISFVYLYDYHLLIVDPQCLTYSSISVYSLCDEGHVLLLVLMGVFATA